MMTSGSSGIGTLTWRERCNCISVAAAETAESRKLKHNVLTAMRQFALLFAVILIATSVAAGQLASSSEKSTPSTSANESQSKSSDPAVSLDKIREGLQQPPGQPLKGVSDQVAQEAAHFKVQVEERRKIEELLSTL